MILLDSRCVHWWIIGDYLVGRCKKCGATKDFEKLREEEQNRRKIHRGKSPIEDVTVLI
jgi:hypothetical protein